MDMICEILRGNIWIDYNFESIKKGMTFRMTNPLTHEVTLNDMGNSELVAITDAYIFKQTYAVDIATHRNIVCKQPTFKEE